ncbi:hypothetical protein RDI58_000296 [Solanum bulbocastanum]|uniref:Secreted protein n=1 Tax=Solanum bulbocastanum TaxID=147425 RepID=A0AAN8YP06_SOLBU
MLRMMTDLMITCFVVQDFLHISWAGPYHWKHQKVKSYFQKIVIINLKSCEAVSLSQCHVPWKERKANPRIEDLPAILSTIDSIMLQM